MWQCICLGMFNEDNLTSSLVAPFESGFGIEFVWFLRSDYFVNYLLFEGKNFK